MKLGDGRRGLNWVSPEARAHHEREAAAARKATAEAEAAAREAAIAADRMPREPEVGDAIMYYSTAWGWIPGTITRVIPAYQARAVGEVLVHAIDKRDNPGHLPGHWSEQPRRCAYGPLIGNWRYTMP